MHCGTAYTSDNHAIMLMATPTAPVLRLAQSIPVVVGKAHGHHVGKELHSVAYL